MILCRYSSPGGVVPGQSSVRRRAQEKPGRVGDAQVTTFEREVKVEVKVVWRSAAVRVDCEHSGQSSRVVDAARQSSMSSHAVIIYLQGRSLPPFYLPTGGCAVLRRVCLSICPSVRSQKRRTSPNFPCMFTVAVARSSSGGVAIRYVLPVLRLTSYSHAVGCVARCAYLWYVSGDSVTA